jgi:hypothetical protein
MGSFKALSGQVSVDPGPNLSPLPFRERAQLDLAMANFLATGPKKV